MNAIWIAGNAISIVGALICTSYLVWVRRKLHSMGVPFVTLTLIGVTAAITGMQFVYPELLSLLARNPEKLMQGELWRVITPMFVQPSGISQCIANAFLLIAFMPMVERLYGRGLLLVFLGAGVLSQIPLNFWLPYGGGSSSAAFGLIGALFCYLLRERKQALLPFVVLPVAGLLAGAMLAVARDGHGAGMWIGFAIASVLPVARFKFENA